MNGRFGGRIAMVTGAGQGIGRATARRLAIEGALVVVNDVNTEGIAETCGLIAKDGGESISGVADVTDEQAIHNLVDQVEGTHGPISILVNNAGGAMPGTSWGSVASSSIHDWNGFLALNLTSAFICAVGHIALGERSGTRFPMAGAGPQ